MTTNERGLVIVTGASSGIGEAIALHLREGGFSVLARVRRDEDAERMRIRGLTPIRLDVTDPEQPAAARAEVGDRPLAGLVNNAGILRGGPLEFVPIDTLSASRYARTPASFVHRMGASTHDLCSPGRDTRGQPLFTTKTRLRLDTPVGVPPGSRLGVPFWLTSATDRYEYSYAAEAVPAAWRVVNATSYFGARTSDAGVGRRTMQAPRLSILRRPKAPSTALGIVVAASFVAVETVAVVLLKHLNPGEAFETLYLLGVLVVSTVWGLGLAMATSVASAIALDYFRKWPAAHFMPFVLENEVAIVVFLFVAMSTNFVAGLARARAAEAHQRGREAGLLFQQQAALRRVATLVANGVGPSEVFAAVAEEMARCLRVVHAMVLRSEPDGAVVVAVYDERESRRLPVGERITLEGDNVTGGVLRTGRVVRMDSYENAPGSTGARMRQLGLRGAVGAPVVVDGRVWGAATVGSAGPEPLPPDTEARISDFADLVATTISNAAARAELRASNDSLSVLAEQQAALRRVATLVARGVRPAQVFAAVADEMARCLGVADSHVVRYDGNDAAIVLASYNAFGLQRLHVGERVTLEGDNVATMVLRTARAARMDNYENAAGSLSARIRELGIRSVAAAPVIVDGRVWGAAFVSSRRPEPLPPDIEERIADFADLVATALANAAAGAELIASRARIVAAGDNARRRLERDLHDGAQQRLVSLGLQIRAFEASKPAELGAFKQQLSEIVSGLTGVSNDLREISRGIHPAILSRGGLGPALKTLARRSTVPVHLDVAIDPRLPDPTEVAAYYVVAEALTNAAKHAQASEVDVRVETKNGNLGIVIRDDGIGGANSGKGSGLVGLKDRVEALGGRMQITSQPGNGTSLHATIPLEIE